MDCDVDFCSGDFASNVYLKVVTKDLAQTAADEGPQSRIIDEVRAAEQITEISPPLCPRN